VPVRAEDGMEIAPSLIFDSLDDTNALCFFELGLDDFDL